MSRKVIAGFAALALAAAGALALAACQTLSPPAAVSAVHAAYCAAVTPEARAELARALTGSPQTVINCDQVGGLVNVAGVLPKPPAEVEAARAAYCAAVTPEARHALALVLTGQPETVIPCGPPAAGASPS